LWARFPGFFLRVDLPRSRLRFCPVGLVREGRGFGELPELLLSVMSAPVVCTVRAAAPVGAVISRRQ